MKTFLSIYFMLAVVSTTVSAQVNYSKDPTYSVHNYKHPNKAAVAKEKNLDRLIHLEYVESGNNAPVNYKQQAGKPSPVIQGALIPSGNEVKSTNALANPRNYKTNP